MSKMTKKVELVQVQLSTEDFSFTDILRHDDFINHSIWVKGKWLEAQILQDGRNLIVGLMITTRSSNIPPKRNRRNKRTQSLGLSDEEGLAYANVFLYDRNKNVLFYEVNKFGCYLDHFSEFIYKSFEDNEDMTGFAINLQPVLNRDEYERMMSMDQHKSLEVVIANPRAVIQEFDGQNNAVTTVINSAAEINSEKFTWKYEVSARSPRSLGSRTLSQIVNQLLRIVRSPVGDNIKKIIVKGYEEDPEEENIATIDLIADRFQSNIELDEPRENVDLLEEQRKTEIIREYRRCLPELEQILGNE